MTCVRAHPFLVSRVSFSWTWAKEVYKKRWFVFLQSRVRNLETREMYLLWPVCTLECLTWGSE